MPKIDIVFQLPCVMHYMFSDNYNETVPTNIILSNQYTIYEYEKALIYLNGAIEVNPPSLLL